MSTEQGAPTRPRLADLAAAGFNVDEWRRWQQGGCLDYARGLLRTHPHLRFGTLYDDDAPTHHFAHDDRYAYDSAGRHPLPYLGVHSDAAYAVLEEDADWYDAPAEDEVTAAIAHAARHRIVEGRFTRTA